MITIVLAALCVALFVWTGFVEGRAPEAFGFPEAMACAKDRPYLSDEDYDGDLRVLRSWPSSKRSSSDWSCWGSIIRAASSAR